MTFYNSTSIKDDANLNFLKYQLITEHDLILKVFRIQGAGNLIAISNRNTVQIFEFVLPYKIGLGMDLGGMRYIM